MSGMGESNRLKNLIRSIESVCEDKGRTRVNGAAASERTFRLQKDVMRQFARTLHEKGYILEDCGNLGEKHINAVFDAWVEKGLSPKTLQNQKSRVKQFCHWLGKPNLAEYVRKVEGRYTEKLPEGFRVKTVAEESKSWRGHDVDLAKLFRLAKAEDARFGAMLLMERAFGLRKKEVLLIKPWKAANAAMLTVRENIAKGGKDRNIDIEPGEFGEMQRRVLDYARAQCKRWESLAWPDMTLQQAERRYFYLCERIGLTKRQTGMTGHGLRAGYAEDLMLLNGLLPSVLGGVTEMSTKGHRNTVKLKTSNAMGHNRMQITHAYYGKDKRFAKAGELLGHQIGEPLVLSKKAKALLWISEKPAQVDGQGRYDLSNELVELAYITVQIVEGEQEIGRLSMSQFLDEHPVAIDGVARRLSTVGLELVEEGEPESTKADGA